jgi:MSHA biogenesis protein MshG
MAAFKFKGRTARGENVNGVLEAESAETLADHLFARGITPIDIKPATGSQDVLQDIVMKLGGGRPKTTDLIMFSRQMYALTNAGLPLLRGMGSLAASTPNRMLREALSGILEFLQAGRDLASSLSRYPGIFSKFFVSVVRIGESTGNLPTAFMRMYEYLGMEKRINDKMRAATRYPTTVVVAIGVAIAVITLFVLPKFEPIFASLGDNLPFATRVLLGVSDFVSNYWYMLIGAFMCSAIGFRVYVSNEQGRYRWDRFKLRIPIVGSIVMKATLAKICRSFALTAESGVPIVQGLGMIARAAGNEYMAEGVLALRNGVERGESVARTAQTLGLFTPLALQMIMVGEETGALGDMLVEVADFYEREVDYELENISSALEPLLIVAVGGMVLVLALGVFLPLWDLAASGGALS